MISRYLARLGLSQPRSPDLAALQALVRAHTQTIPFENLDPLGNRPVRLDPASLQAKLLEAGRGGYCFEQNLLMRYALEALGYRVTGLLARVRWNVPEDVATPRTHMVLRVQLPEGPHLVDVGFGGQTLTAPLRFEPELVQPTPHEPYRMLEQDGLFTLQAQIGEQWRTLYLFDLQEQQPIDYELPNWWTSAHPNSHFRSVLIAARADEHVRYTLRDLDMGAHRSDGSTFRRRLRSLEEVLEVLQDTFHVAVPDDRAVREALTRIVSAG
jgi:N-hydroxyarylamine O-acetyltransferase